VDVIGGVSGADEDAEFILWFGRHVDHARMSTGLMDGNAAFMAKY